MPEDKLSQEEVDALLETPAEQPAAKPHLHATDLKTLGMCTMRYYFRRVENIIAPPGIAMVVGSSVHKSVERDMRSKMETTALAPLVELQEIAEAGVKLRFETGVAVDEKEAKVGEKVLRGKAIDKAVTLAALHHQTLAPSIEPTMVEEKWVIKMDGYPMDLEGQTDLEELNCIRDTKTSAKSPKADAADRSDQLTMYTLARHVHRRPWPKHLYLDTLVHLKTPKPVTQRTVRDEQDIEILLRKIQAAIEFIDAGKYFPCDPGVSWWCTPASCGYWKHCPYAKKPVSVPVG